MGNRTKQASKKRINGYRPILVEFKDDRGRPVFFDPRDVKSIRGGGGDWTDKVSLVNAGGPAGEMAIMGSAAEVHAAIRLHLGGEPEQVPDEPAMRWSPRK